MWEIILLLLLEEADITVSEVYYLETKESNKRGV